MSDSFVIMKAVKLMKIQLKVRILFALLCIFHIFLIGTDWTLWRPVLAPGLYVWHPCLKGRLRRLLNHIEEDCFWEMNFTANNLLKTSTWPDILFLAAMQFKLSVLTPIPLSKWKYGFFLKPAWHLFQQHTNYWVNNARIQLLPPWSRTCHLTPVT